MSSNSLVEKAVCDEEYCVKEQVRSGIGEKRREGCKI